MNNDEVIEHGEAVNTSTNAPTCTGSWSMHMMTQIGLPIDLLDKLDVLVERKCFSYDCLKSAQVGNILCIGTTKS